MTVAKGVTSYSAEYFRSTYEGETETGMFVAAEDYNCLVADNQRMRKALEIIREGSGGWAYQLSHAALSGKDVV